MNGKSRGNVHISVKGAEALELVTVMFEYNQKKKTKIYIR